MASISYSLLHSRRKPWSLQWFPPEGKRKYLRFSTREEAEQYLNDLPYVPRSNPGWPESARRASLASRIGRTNVESTVDRLRRLSDVTETGCWIWAGRLDGNSRSGGYGRITIPGSLTDDGRPKPGLLAHRVSYETFVGPIPVGLTLDHLCRETRCINPDHLEPVTLSENLRRRHAAVRAEKAQVYR